MSEYTMIPVERIFPHPDNPRKDLGDLSELAESIKANGILQNLTVVPAYQVSAVASAHESGEIKMDGEIFVALIGHRRLAAAKMAGLAEVPCVVATMTPQEQIETMLMENMQRSDLTVYEQAQGFQMMIDLGDSVEVVAQKTGFSETTIRRRLKMAELDQDKLKEVSARQLSLGDFDKLAQIDDIKTRNKVLGTIGTSEFNRELTSAMRDQSTKKKLPEVKKWLKEVGAQKIRQEESWGGKYEQYPGSPWRYSIGSWGEGDNHPPKSTKKPMFFYIDGDTLRIFAEKEKPKKEKKSAAEMAEIKNRNAAWKEAHEKTELMFTLRKQFVAALTGTKKNTDLMVWGALAAISLGADYHNIDRDGILAALGLETGYSSDREKKVVAAYRGADLKIAPQLVYAAFGDNAQEGYVCGVASYEFPKHEENPSLDLLYDWLASLGYEMSEEEKQLRDGTHEVFKRSGK